MLLVQAVKSRMVSSIARRQMGHSFTGSLLAHGWHITAWPHGRMTVSIGATMQILHERSTAPPGPSPTTFPSRFPIRSRGPFGRPSSLRSASLSSFSVASESMCPSSKRPWYSSRPCFRSQPDTSEDFSAFGTGLAGAPPATSSSTNRTDRFFALGLASFGEGEGVPAE